MLDERGHVLEESVYWRRACTGLVRLRVCWMRGHVLDEREGVLGECAGREAMCWRRVCTGLVRLRVCWMRGHVLDERACTGRERVCWMRGHVLDERACTG